MDANYTVYPRWRGEHYVTWGHYGIDNGLSPLARGTLTVRGHFRFSDRFIPAGAGNTLMMQTGRVYVSVYPRWRGEHSNYAASCAERVGLSPLARGTLKISPAPAVPRRFIPAGAGNTGPDAVGQSRHPVYPRWRGEHIPASWCLLNWPGLSPLARGTPCPMIVSRLRWRFIPAGAGNTLRMEAVLTE